MLPTADCDLWLERMTVPDVRRLRAVPINRPAVNAAKAVSHDKGKPAARLGRKATGPLPQRKAGLPKGVVHTAGSVVQLRHAVAWEPGDWAGAQRRGKG